MTEVYLRLWTCPEGHLYADQSAKQSPHLASLTCITCGDGCSVEAAVPIGERRCLEDLENLLSQAKTLGVL
ncbi:hypothetical protein BRD56_10450 [Thermoplasmatales archaeon SW_10_69_26]|nr:MAG: hypothetical protein BRD56_10450 [Thermoplasmatales archaeon SW_10_69_26]